MIDTTTGEAVELALVDARTGKPIGPQHKVIRDASRSRAARTFSFDGEADETAAAG